MSTFEIDIRATREFIKKVDLAPAHRTPKRVKTTKESVSGYINVGAIEVHQNSLPEQQQKDAQNWILFAQLAADAAAARGGYSRVSDPEQWYKSFVGFLNRLAMRSGGQNRQEAKTQQLDVNAAQTALNLLNQYFSKDDRVLIERVFQDLRLPLNEGALKIFHKAASAESGGNFLVLSASVDRFLNLTINLGYLDFQCKDSVDRTNMLFWKWDKERVDCFYGKDVLTLSKSVADVVRSSVEGRVGAIRDQHIIPIIG